MELSDYLRILRRRGWLIILLALLTAGAAYGLSRMQDNVYKSSVKLLVRPARTDFGQAQAAKTLLRGYVAWLDSSYRAAAVIDKLQLDMEPQALKGDVTIASDDSSFIIQIDVKNSDPNIANDIAREWGDLLIQDTIRNNATQRKEDRVEVARIDDPVAGLYSPKPTINAAAGLVLGALLGVILIFVLEWLDSGVLRRVEDVERHLDVPVIGSIPG